AQFAARRKLQALDACFLDVVVLVDGARRDARLPAQYAVVDQVVDLVAVEVGSVGAALVVPVHAQLEGAAGFRLDVGIAEEGVRTFGTDVVGRNLLEGRRAESFAVAGLEGQLRGGAPDQPGARAGFAAEDLVVVQTCAEGQRPVVA